MNRPNFLEEIENRIKDAPKGAVFITSDFLDIAETQTVNQALSRLCKNQAIFRRVMRGVYERPEYSDFLQEFIAPDPNKIAFALARNFGWTIVPCGNTALNLLGLSTQVTSIWSYVSDGPYKRYELDSVTLQFKHTTNKEITGISHKSALVVQALKALGQEGSQAVISKLAKSLSTQEKEKLLSETQYVTSWIYEVIKKICRRSGKNA